MRVTWEVDDGYVGNRPHHIEFSDDEFEGLNEKEREEYINDTIQEEFEQKITWYIKRIDE